MNSKEKELLKLAIKGLTDNEPLRGEPVPEDYIPWEHAMEILCALRDGKKQTVFIREYYKKFGSLK